jgi:hypothetical protein
LQVSTGLGALRWAPAASLTARMPVAFFKDSTPSASSSWQASGEPRPPVRGNPGGTPGMTPNCASAAGIDPTTAKVA